MTYDDNVKDEHWHQWKLATTNQRIDTYGKLQSVEIIVFCKFCLKTKIIKEIVSAIEKA